MSSDSALKRDHVWKLVETARALLDHLGLSPAERRRICEYLAAEDPGAIRPDSADGETDEAWLTLDEWPGFPELDSEAAELGRKKKAFSLNLKKRLAETGLSQLALAARLGISDSAVSQYVSGKHKPQSRTLHKLAEVLECSVGDLWPE